MNHDVATCQIPGAKQPLISQAVNTETIGPHYWCLVLLISGLNLVKKQKEEGLVF